MSASTLAASAAAPVPGQPALPVKHKTLLTIAVMGASIVQILDSTIANVAIPHMQSSLGATLDTVTWVLTSYIIAGAVAMPLTGWLADRIGSRNLFIGATAGFTVASMLCGIAVTLEEMVLFRVFQGICAAFIGPLSQTILLDINPPEKASRAMATWGMGIMVAPIFGPMIGGWLTESYNWRWVFYINLPIGIPTLAVLWWLLPSKPLARRRLDLFGFAALALALAALQLLLDRGQQEDWLQSWEIVIEAGVAIAAFWVFAIHTMTSRNPIFTHLLLTNRNFVTAMMFSVVIGLMMFGIFALLPPLLQNIYGYPVYDTGVLLAPRGLGILIAMFVASRLAGRMDMRILIGVGFGVTVVSMWMMTGWALDMPSSAIAMAGLVQGLGMGLTFMPINVMAFATLSPQLRTDGSSLLYLMRSLGGSIGISLTTTALTRNIQTSHEDLAGRITSSSFATIDPATADRWGPLGDAAMQAMNLEVTRQAAMIAYLSDFKLMMFVVLAFMPLILLLRPPKDPQVAQPPTPE
jgi:MFS transporter, DHA2 family, multidrug resistance protein